MTLGYNQSAYVVLNCARNLAHVNEHEYVRTDHLLGAILCTGECNGALVGLRAPPVRLRRSLVTISRDLDFDQVAQRMPAAERLPLSPRYKHIERCHARQAAHLLRRKEIDPDCLLAGILMNPTGLGYQALDKHRVNLEKFMKIMASQADDEGSELVTESD